jgi:hypothetical protein
MQKKSMLNQSTNILLKGEDQMNLPFDVDFLMIFLVYAISFRVNLLYFFYNNYASTCR